MNLETDDAFPLAPGLSKSEIEQRFWVYLYIVRSKQKCCIVGLCCQKASGQWNWSRLPFLIWFNQYRTLLNHE